jgi:type IV pilus assembly protein PilB
MTDLPFIHIDHINEIIHYAHEKRASDIHLEPHDNEYRIRIRQDGLLTVIFSGSHTLASRINTQIKVMAGLDIAEQRLPQDGRITFLLNNHHALDIRVSTCPTLYGEKIVLRILDQRSQIRPLETLGLMKSQEALLLLALQKTQGLILVTGPTGSGKTTTLYTALHLLNQSTHNIATVEDPVEIALPGINQVGVHAKINLTFARVLRSLLRQDPDIILIGEIRDKETAEIAIQAAQTGHLVLSTVHASSTLETINRLMHMGIARYELLSTLNLIVAQRLLRKKEGTGRMGVYECLPITEKVRRYLLNEESITLDALKQHEPIITLLDAAMDKVHHNQVTLAEVKRVIGHAA